MTCEVGASGRVGAASGYPALLGIQSRHLSGLQPEGCLSVEDPPSLEEVPADMPGTIPKHGQRAICVLHVRPVEEDHRALAQLLRHTNWLLHQAYTLSSVAPAGSESSNGPIPLTVLMSNPFGRSAECPPWAGSCTAEHSPVIADHAADQPIPSTVHTSGA